MLYQCCSMMKLYGRVGYPNVKEEELPDATIEYDVKLRVWNIRSTEGVFDLRVHFCPWCAADLERLSSGSG